MTLNISFQSLLAYKVSFEKSADSLMETPLQVIICFSLAAFKILFNFWHFNYDMSWCGPLWVQLVWDSLCFLDLCVYFLHQIGKFSFIIFSNKFSISCSFSSPSGIPMIQMLVHLEMSQRLLRPSSFLKFFSSCSSDWILLSSLCSKSLIWTLASSPPPLVPCRFFFIVYHRTSIDPSHYWCLGHW